MNLTLFTGKGGVGKTTLAAASAVSLAGAGRKVLAVSTDQAHSLGDVLDVLLRAEPVEVSDGLFAAHVSGRALVDRSWSVLRRHLHTILAASGVGEVAAEELTVLPGVEELLALAEVAELAGTGPWDTVVVDCAPTAETLRLLALPEAVAGYVERLFPSHRRMVRGVLSGLAGPRSGGDWDAAADALTRLGERASALRALLADHRTTGVQLVLTPERVVAAETRRTLTTLALLGVRVDGLLVNRLVPESAHPWLSARRTEQDAVLASVREWGPPVRSFEYLEAEPVGLPALTSLGVPLLDGSEAEKPSVRRVTGEGRDLDAEFELLVPMPLPAGAALDLARVGDRLAVTVDGHRRLLDLPPVLRRCAVVGASRDGDGLRVRFRPDEDAWLR